MTIKKILSAAAITMCFSVNAVAQSGDAKMDKFITDLMSKMTLREKIGQLNLPASGDIVTGEAKSGGTVDKAMKGDIGGVFSLKGVDKIYNLQKLVVEKSRLHIPLIFGMDVIHGYETVFPIPYALSCSWDMDAVKLSARMAAQEATADGLNWTFSPMLDICRDPRWGRMSEGNGEDPYLASRIAEAMVKGYQGDDLSKENTMMSCVKHFALYGGSEAGRDYNTVDMSRWRMFNYYMPPYKAAFDAGAMSAMASFNVVEGVPATGNKWLLTDVLRNMWGFKGMVVSDYTGISEMIDHGMGDLQQVSALALKAGLDMDMVAEGFLGTLEKSIKEGKVSEADVDKACRRILEAKYRLGLFDDPYRYCKPDRAKTEIYTPANRAEARRVAAETFVLLKNDNNLLPLKKEGKVALVGPLADAASNMPGTWAVTARSGYKSLLQAMRDALKGKAEVLYAKGCNLTYNAKLEADATMFGREMRDNRSDREMLDEALKMAEQADVIVAAIGESSEFSGECSSRSDLSILDAQKDLLTALKKTGKPIVLVNFSGRATVMTWEVENFASILNVWFGGSESGDAICDVVFGDKVPSGKTTCTMPKNMGQIPIFYNHLNTGRPLADGAWFQKFRSNYIDIDNEPLFPFGYGLSYTTFKYGKPVLSASEMKADGSITLSVDVTNTGNYDGTEVVQLYIRDLVASVSRPVKELKGFERINLKKGETKTVKFTITASDLKFYNQNLDYILEPGYFDVMVGTNSKDVQKVTFKLL